TPAARPAPARDDQARRFEVRESAWRQIQGAQGAIHIYQLAEEMIEEAVADIGKLNKSVVSPMAMRSMGLSPNLNAQFGDFVESTLVSYVVNNTPMVIKRCIACQSLRSRIDQDDWVVSMGFTQHEDLQREAERLGAQTYLDARLSFFPGANIVALQVEIYRAHDGAILWTETYRSDATTAAILRSGDRMMTRPERVKELERRLDARPYYGHILYVGTAYIPYDHPNGGIGGMSIGYRLYEKFGRDRRYLFGVGAEGFANFDETSGILGTFVSGTLQYEIFEPNLNDPIYRTGPTLGGFFAGTEGNSFVFEWGLDVIMQFRLGAGVSAFYFLPTEFAGYDLGGFGGKGRVSFNW
ncbi:MAG: hypothetical protein ACNA8W_22750, partial [Bradymonadaceae bacterium]